MTTTFVILFALAALAWVWVYSRRNAGQGCGHGAGIGEAFITALAWIIAIVLSIATYYSMAAILGTFNAAIGWTIGLLPPVLVLGLFGYGTLIRNGVVPDVIGPWLKKKGL